MDALTKKLNDSLTELETRARTRTSLVDIERMYGFVLGVIAAMEATNHPNAKYARENNYQLLVPKRDKLFWQGAVIVKVKE